MLVELVLTVKAHLVEPEVQIHMRQVAVVAELVLVVVIIVVIMGVLGVQEQY